ncbi:MAG TPA: hypothetical protein PK079_15195 [Leptospiraceae bacterium]|nr:hypothetical protein [Leptospiraceae bacterium]HMW07234.1 hypothetical protein [Leptospiraceae bacterium]HMX35390.1 hypothetical protein [Leptospiraceae bacterium]HMY32616.1 hypothetical protein [Leptospiraceae bacterium]HMZ63757.1 hypothetical protein [Leptospiraceae bacterium]
MKSFLLFFSLFLFLIQSCAPKKDQVSDTDLKRLIDRVSMVRLSQNLDFDPSEGKPLKTDYQIFKEVCELFRLDSTQALEKLKSQHPELYKSIMAKR